MVSIQNEIRTRYEFASFEAIQGEDRAACQYTLGFPCWSTRCLKTPQKQDTRLKNEIGMNLGNTFLPPLISSLNLVFFFFGWDVQREPKPKGV